MGDEGEHPDDERQRGPDQRRKRDQDATDPHVGPGPERPLEVGLLLAQADHGELGGGEGEQHPEGVGAREERGVVAAEDPRRDHDRDRDRPGCQECLARDERAPLEAAELPRQHAVLAHRAARRVHPVIAVVAAANRISAPERPTTMRSTSTSAVGQVPLERRHDPDDRRLEPLVGEVGRAVLGGERGQPDDGDQHRHDHDEPDRGEERARQRPARLAVSSARLATVSSPVYASIASGSAKKRSCQLCPAARSNPLVSTPGREEDGEPEDDHEQLHRDVEQRQHECGGADLRAATSRAPTIPTITPTAIPRPRGSWSATAPRARRRGSEAGTASTARSRSGSRGRAPSPW